MGSTLEPTLANIFIGFIEAKVISSFKLRYFRHGDDCFVLAENEEVVDELFAMLNEVHNAIKFTV